MCIVSVEFTCFSNFDWSLKHEAKLMNDWYEQWSKAGGAQFSCRRSLKLYPGF